MQTLGLAAPVSGAVKVAEWEEDAVFQVTFLSELRNDSRTGLSEYSERCGVGCMQHSMHAEGCFLGPHHPDAPLKEPLSVMIMPRLEADGETCKAVAGSVKRP